MSDPIAHVATTPPVGGVEPTQPVRRTERPAGNLAPDSGSVPEGATVAATTGGSLRQAYAQFVVNPDTKDVVLRIRDSATGDVINEMPSKEVEAVSAYLKKYLETLARHRAALRAGAGR